MKKRNLMCQQAKNKISYTNDFYELICSTLCCTFYLVLSFIFSNGGTCNIFYESKGI